jgi:hypothetical protein
MKRILTLLVIITAITGCAGLKTTASGLENQSYIKLIGNSNQYWGGVSLVIDDNEPINAKVTKDNASYPKGTVYAISTGKHVVKVISKDKIIYQKQIFISNQETRKIILP